MIYISSDANGEESMYSKRAPHMPSIALVILIIVIIAKNGISKPHQIMMNYIPPGLVLHADSESAVRYQT